MSARAEWTRGTIHLAMAPSTDGAVQRLGDPILRAMTAVTPPPTMRAVSALIYRRVLGVHRVVGLARAWRITHVPTGLAMPSSTRTRQAEVIALAERIFPLVRWERVTGAGQIPRRRLPALRAALGVRA